MTLKCPNCGGNVGEACCNGMSQTKAYRCSGCKQWFDNPKYVKGRYR